MSKFGSTNRIMRLRVREMLFVADPDPVECLMSLLLIAWGIWLILPFETFVTMTSYRPMVDVIDERLAGIVVLALGAVRLYMILNNRVRPRRWMAILFGMFWGFNCFLALQANPGSLLVPVYGVFLAASLWIAYRLNGRPYAE